MTPQELRNSILQLAIQGKLVEQRPEEGTAEALYREIQREKARLIKENKIKKEKPLPEIAEDEKPFEIPEGWMWVRLKSVATILYGYPFESSFFSEISEGTPLIRIRDVLPARTKTFTTEKAPQDYIVNNGEMLVGMDGNFNVNFWQGGTAYLNQRVCKITANENSLLQRYLYYYLPTALDEIFKSVSYVTVKHLSDKHLTALIVPLPPLAEQKRIVAKIEALLPYVDRYEQAWNRLEAFNKRFPDDMRKSILQLAIQGKLVGQRPEEGTAEALYREIQREKARLIKEGKVKKEKPLPEIAEDEKPFEIPEGWRWVRIGDLFQHNTGKALNSSDKSGKPYEYITTSNVYWNRFELGKLKTMLFTDEELAKCSVQKGDLLVLEGGDIGRTAIWNYDFPMRIQNHIHRLRPFSTICIEYFYYIFFFYKHAGLISGKGIAIQGLSSNALHSLIVPLPPLAEQKRIVERLEELLAMCEKLK